MFRTLVLAALLLATPAAAADGQPNPERRPKLLGAPDLDFALRELCYPFVRGEASMEALTKRQGVVAAHGQQPWADGMKVWMVGRADLMLAMGTNRFGNPSCTVRITAGDPAQLRGQVDAALPAWRVPLTPVQPAPGAGAYQSRDLLCAPPTGPHDAMLISTSAKPTGGPKMMLSLLTGPERGRACGGG